MSIARISLLRKRIDEEVLFCRIFTDGFEVQEKEFSTGILRRIALLGPKEKIVTKRIEKDSIIATRFFMIGLKLELESSSTNMDLELILLLVTGVSPISPLDRKKESLTERLVVFVDRGSLSLWNIATTLSGISQVCTATAVW